MINSLSQKVVKWFLSNEIIDKGKEELYTYGMFMIISHLMFLLYVIALSSLLFCLLRSLVFFFAFMLIRKYAGGYHATTETKCELLTTLSLTSCIVLIKLFSNYDIKVFILIISLVCFAIICFLCPLDTKEKPLSKNEYKYFKKISMLSVLLIFVSIIATVYIKSLNMFSLPLSFSLLLETILLISGKFNRIKK